MALQDIIAAIHTEAERDILAQQHFYEERKKERVKKHKEKMHVLHVAMTKEVEDAKRQRRLKAETRVVVTRRKRIAETKQSLISAVFQETLTMLQTLPDEKVESFLRTCLRRIKAKGLLYVSKKHEALLRHIASSAQCEIAGTLDDSVGGFRFVGETFEADFTFEHLVYGVLQPLHELDIATRLFHHSS